MKAATGARVYMHQSDAVMLEMGRGMRRLTRVPGLVNALLHRVITGAVPSEVEAVQVDQYLNDGEVLPIAGGIDVIHTPGHTEGHVVFRSRMYNALFLGDAAANLLGLREMFVNEQRRQSQWSLKKLAGYRFNTACFGHGSPILAGGGGLFHAKWGDARKRR